MTDRTRREVVRAGVVLGAGLLAGCTGSTNGSDPADSPTDTPSATPTTSATATPTPTDTPTQTATPGDPGIVDVTFSSGDGSCGSTARAAVTATDAGFRVTGTIVAATPCHRAALAGYRVDGSRVRLRIRVRDPKGTPACVQCIGAIPFELSARTRGIETVVVDVGGKEPETVRATI